MATKFHNSATLSLPLSLHTLQDNNTEQQCYTLNFTRLENKPKITVFLYVTHIRCLFSTDIKHFPKVPIKRLKLFTRPTCSVIGACIL